MRTIIALLMMTSVAGAQQPAIVCCPTCSSCQVDSSSGPRRVQDASGTLKMEWDCGSGDKPPCVLYDKTVGGAVTCPDTGRPCPVGSGTWDRQAG
jgi:hypothetical protein